MKVIDRLKEAKSTLFSFEVIPPLKGQGINSIFKVIDPLIEFDPQFINVTYHREEYAYEELEDGTFRRYVTRKRPGTVGIAAAIANRYNVTTVAHLLCGGFTKDETENVLIDLDFLGIKNILALRGDKPKNESRFRAEKQGHKNAKQLVEQIVNLNNGEYQNKGTTNTPTDFCIGVSGYPEKHFESPNMEYDLRKLKEKVDAGGQYIVTQMFFDNDKFFDFVKRCREIGIDVPIIPGIKLLSRKGHLSAIPSFFHLDMPEPLVKEVEKCKTRDQVKEVGVEWAIMQCKELKQKGAPCIHFYTLSRADGTKRVAEAVF